MQDGRSGSTDRRYRRTRRAIREAFVALVLERGYAKVTIEALMERADLSRGTFYAHFDDVEQLLGEVVRELIDDLLSMAKRVMPSGRVPVAKGDAIMLLVSHVDAHRDLYRLILSGAGNGSGRAAYVDALTLATERVSGELAEVHRAVPRIPVAIVARSFAGAFASLLDWWLFSEPERSVADVTAIATSVAVRGFMWSLGMEGIVTLSPDVVATLERSGGRGAAAARPPSHR